MKQALDEAKRLRLEARKLPPEKALPLLEEGIAGLKRAVEEGGEGAEVFRELAECLGMKGGALRRLGKLDDSIEAYQQGRKYEQDEKHGADDSYNLVNALVVPLLRQPAQLDAHDFRVELSEAVRLLQRQVHGPRKDDFWAHADLARCLLLSSQYEQAIHALDRFVQLGGVKEAFSTTLQMLQELVEALSADNRSEAELLARGIAYFSQASKSGSAVERVTCFVLMPFGRKDNAAGVSIDFDQIYKSCYEPAILDAGLAPVRADAETQGPVIHKAMFERLLLSEIAVADLTLNNPNVFYELGVRHGNRARATVLLSGEHSAPFDVNLLRTLRYRLGADGKLAPDEAARVRAALKAALGNAKERLHDTTISDNPIHALLQDFKSLDQPARYKTDVFRDAAEYAQEIKQKLAAARQNKSVRDLRKLEERIRFDETEPAVMIDLMLSYRALASWEDMLTLIARLPKVVRDTVMVREQQALALNRRNKGGDGYQAIQIIEGLISERGPSSESYSILGRIYKDKWRAVKDSEPLRARGLLRKAIDAYRKGFVADVRDTYPGVNLVSLLYIDGSEHALKDLEHIMPVVSYVAEQRNAGKRDYWDFATLLELSVLRGDSEEIVQQHLSDALSAVRESFEPESTAANLRDIRDASKARNKPTVEDRLLGTVVDELEKASKR